MKVFHQAPDESIVINGEITVTVLKIDGDEVHLGIDAPEWVSIEESPALLFGVDKRQFEVVRKSAPLPAR
jgi:carbon storage regulator CsrA